MQYIIQNVYIYPAGSKKFLQKQSVLMMYVRIHTYIPKRIHTSIKHVFIYRIKVSLYTRMDRKFEFFTRFSVKIFKSCNFLFLCFIQDCILFFKKKGSLPHRVGTIKFCSLFQVNNGKTFYYPDIHFALTLLI